MSNTIFNKIRLSLLLWVVSTSAWALMPANGIWQIDSEANGQPGRGFTINVENEVMFFTYYGYRADGTSLFYIAAGPVVNNTFTADLLNVQGGTVLGDAYKPATLIASPGKVTLTFTSGKRGTMTLPGESLKAISKYSFGYEDGPDGLLGTWLITSTVGTTSFVTNAALNAKLGATSTGNGVVANSTGSFACEFQVSGMLAGLVVCINYSSSVSDGYAFSFAGDRGTGVNMYGPNNDMYESHALRISTKTGTETGINDGTASSLQSLSAGGKPFSASSPIAAYDHFSAQAKEYALASQPPSAYGPEKAAAYAAWSAEANRLINMPFAGAIK